MDMTKLGLECSRLMEDLAGEFPDGAEVGVVGLVVEVECDDGATHIATFCSDTRRWVQIGFFHEAAYAAGRAETSDAD